jgi:hypothetical protein
LLLIFNIMSQLLSAFQQSHPESQEFELRLIELLAVSCHQIAVHLFELDDGVHKHRLYEEWRHSGRKSGEYFAPTAFFHGSYVDSDQYPNGVADVVGYWAEAKIFGGVVVFDRGPSGTEVRVTGLEYALNSMSDSSSCVVPGSLSSSSNLGRAPYNLPADTSTIYRLDRLSAEPRASTRLLSGPNPRHSRQPMAVRPLGLHSSLQHFS